MKEENNKQMEIEVCLVWKAFKEKKGNQKLQNN